MRRFAYIALFAVSISSRAHAQPAAAQAEVLFRQAREMMAAKKYAEACAAFDASQKLDPAISTLLNQADCREKNGQLATAWGLFFDAERQTRAATDAPTVKLHKVAGDRAKKLEPRLSKLTIAIAPDKRITGLAIARNGEAVDPGTWNRTLPVDGGTYKLSATAAQHDEWTTTITIANEGDSKTVDIPALKVMTRTPPPLEPLPKGPDAKPAPHPDLETSRRDTPSRGRSKLVPIVLTGAAVVMFGGAIGFELSGRNTYDQAKVEIDDAKQNALWQSANHKRYFAEGFAVGGLACAGIAVWMFLHSGGDESPTVARGISVEPMFAADGVGLSMHARY